MFGNNKREDVERLLRGSRNMDRMKSEIESFVKIIAFFLTHTAPADFGYDENPKKFTFEFEHCRWLISVIVENSKIVEAKIICEIPTSIYDVWYKTYQFDAVKGVTNQQMKLYDVRKIYDKLPDIEEKLRMRFRWNRILKPIIEASEMKF